jgi:diguanylate cyclase (GGDEF)-like protein
MLSPPTISRRHHASELPPEIYIPLVDSLYKEGRTLLVGSIMAVGAVLTTYWKTGEVWLLACTIAIGLVAAARGWDMRAYARSSRAVRTTDDARHWERRYAAGAAASVALLGIWCFACFAATADPFARLVSFSMTIAYVVGISGRNFGSGRLVIVQIACAWLPMTAALLIYGGIYEWIFAGLLVPFFTGLKFISDRLRNTLLDAVTATREMTSLAKRFDTALNNMPHGLCMFDAGRRIVVSNHMLNRQLGLPASIELKGSNPEQLVRHCIEAGLISGQDATRLVGDIDAGLSGSQTNEIFVEFLNGRTLELTFQPMENGGMVALVEDITERRIAEAKINHLARFDALTGLPNRIVLRDRMDKALAETKAGSLYAIHFIDLDQFKQVNDTLGHSRGDMLLQAVADRLQGLVRKSDVVSRFGGDEFIVLQSPMRSIDEASAFAHRILKELGQPYDIDGHQVVISASIGIACAPRDGVDADQLLKNADMALYQTKADRRGAISFFRPEMGEHAQARRHLELDLRNALENDSFEVYYQPLFDLKTKRITTCEALLRWPHPERGMISPSEFIPVAEEMGLIVEIGQRVLRKACVECRKWPNNISVAVNLSPTQFGRADIPALIRETLAITGLPANRLEVEITETILLQDTARTRMALQQLQALGVSISLDDFGTGYSSLSYLHSFPLHKVKIDQSFLKNLSSGSRMLTLLRGITRLSAELGLRVAVEGVETKEQLQLISTEATVDEVQGYLFGKPMPGPEMRKLLYGVLSQTERVA